MEKELILRNFEAFRAMLDAEMTIVGPIQEFLRTFRTTILKYFTPEDVYANLFDGGYEYIFADPDDYEAIIKNIKEFLETGIGNLNCNTDFEDMDRRFTGE